MVELVGKTYFQTGGKVVRQPEQILEAGRYRFVLFTALLLLAGCSSVRLEKARKLSFMKPPQEFPLRWQESLQEKSVGYQFLGPLPMGVIEIDQPGLHLLRALENEMAQHGLRPVTVSSGEVPSLRLDSISLTAYDLFITRKINCDSTAQLTRGRKSVKIESDYQAYHRFAFKPELNHTLERCLSNLAQKIYQQL